MVKEWQLSIVYENNTEKTLTYRGNENIIITSPLFLDNQINFPLHILEKFIEMIK